MNITSQLKPLLSLSAYTLSSSLGLGMQANLDQLRKQKSSLRRNDLEGVDLDTWIGRVDGVESQQLPEGFADWGSRNNQLLELGLQQDGFIDACTGVLDRYGSDRVGLFVGTSTSGIQAAEAAYAMLKPGADSPDFNYRRTQNLFSAGSYLRRRLGITGPGLTISTACSSSAKIFAAAHRHIVAGFCDAAIVVGVDSLCQMTLYGFNSLQLVSSQACRPGDLDRDGISVGEAMAAVILEPATENSSICLLGYGESSDAWHMSTPHPEGAGAARAMQSALSMAGLNPAAVDYVNLHGTGTQANDLAEDRAMRQVFSSGVACSSTKGFSGHTLGAAGIVEALVCALALENNFYPVSLNTENKDPRIQSQLVMPGAQIKYPPLCVAMSNSFGFGGSNASLILTKNRKAGI